MIFLLLFIAIPFIEIGLFIEVGGTIGLGWTMLLCVFTAILGASLIRMQGLTTLLSAKSNMAKGALPIQEMFDGLCLAFAGAVLITPGFFTDAVGFLLLAPPFRVWLRRRMSRHIDMQFHGTNASHNHSQERMHQKPDVIEAEYERVEDDKTP